MPKVASPSVPIVNKSNKKVKFTFDKATPAEKEQRTIPTMPSLAPRQAPKRPKVPEKMRNAGYHHATSLLGELVGEIHPKDESESMSTLSESSLDGLSEAFEGMSIFIDDYIMVEAAEVAPVRPCGAWTCIVKREWGNTEGNS